MQRHKELNYKSHDIFKAPYQSTMFIVTISYF